jgi:D-alanyl-D-alanine carboxypeptidase (penicillin-binding protein 5/6)
MLFKILDFFKSKKVIITIIFLIVIIGAVKNWPDDNGKEVKSESKSSKAELTKIIKENSKKYQPKYDWYKSHPGDLGLTAQSAIVIDQKTGEVLFAKDEHKKLPPASITKVLTLTVVLENMKPDQLCTVSQGAADTQPNKITMKVGEKLRVEDLLYGLTMISANDAAEVLAECYDGGREKFIEKMNEKVQLLGLSDSKFYDPNGLNDETQVSSSFDIGTITRYLLLTKPEAIKYLGRKDDYSVYPTDHNESHYWYQMSHLLQNYSGMEGAKTGYTHVAKNTYVGIAKKADRRIIIVYFAAETTTSDATSLLEYGFSVKP